MPRPTHQRRPTLGRFTPLAHKKAQKAHYKKDLCGVTLFRYVIFVPFCG
jgi:hypothetical protein